MRNRWPVVSVPFVLFVLVVLAGCPARGISKIDPTQHPEEVKVIPVSVNRDVDILFVIDNSGSMSEEQASLVANFGRFTGVLNNIEGGLPNVHIGVVSSDVGIGGFQYGTCAGEGDDGRLQNAARGACQPPAGYFISDIEDPNAPGARITNHAGSTLAASFACIAQLGTDGCGFEQHLESMKRALDGSNPQNDGFLRPDAFLAVIVIADEDDCSAIVPDGAAVFNPADTNPTGPLGPMTSFRCTEFGIECDGSPPSRAAGQYTTCGPRTDSPYIEHPQHFIDFLKGLKPDHPELVLVAGIIGNPTPVSVSLDNMSRPTLDPSCGTGTAEAAPGVRFASFLEGFPNRNTFTSICNTDLSDALTKVAELLASVVGNPCLDGDIDTTDLDGVSPGLQLDCTISDVKNRNESNQTATPIRRCDMAADGITAVVDQELPCWYAVVDELTCADSPTHLILSIVRAGAPPPDTTVVARCAADPHT